MNKTAAIIEMVREQKAVCHEEVNADYIYFNADTKTFRQSINGNNEVVNINILPNEGWKEYKKVKEMTIWQALKYFNSIPHGAIFTLTENSKFYRIDINSCWNCYTLQELNKKYNTNIKIIEEKSNEWIKVKDQLPPVNEMVLYFVHNRYIHVGHMENDKKWYNDYTGDNITIPIYWKHIEKLPK
jgi:hypothetical protein